MREYNNRAKESAKVRQLLSLINGVGADREGWSMNPKTHELKVGRANFKMSALQHKRLNELGYKDEGKKATYSSPAHKRDDE